MRLIYWILFAALIVDSVVGGYYLLQIYFNLKPGRSMGILTDSWFWHPEYLHGDGQAYRRKYFYSFAVFVLLVIVLNVLIGVEELKGPGSN